MAEEAPEIQINVKGPSELKLQINISTDKTVLELKQAIAAKSDVEADRQRLIYSGRVLKDEEPLSAYKIQSSHTIHMVKGVSRSGGGGGGPSSSSSTGTGAGAPTQQLPTMQTGQNVHDPLTQLNSHLGFGAMAGLNPFGEMGLNANDPNMMQSMLNSPQFLQQMSSLLSNPAVMDQIIASNPQLAAMGPQVRAAMQDEGFRQMISNPETFQQMMRLSSMMGGPGGMGMGMGSPFGFPGQQPQSSFPAPGTPNTNTNTSSTTSPTSPSTANNSTTSPQLPPVNPFSLFGGLGAPGAGAGAGAGTPGAAAGAGTNPFGFNPALMQQMLYGGGGLGGFGGAPPTPTPADTRPPEERFQVQLQQLQDMGFTNASQNVRALLATGGNVQSAIDYIFGGGGV